MKDLALFIRKNFVQFIIAITILTTAGIMLSNAYMHRGLDDRNKVMISQNPKAIYYIEAKVFSDSQAYVFITTEPEDECVIIDNNLFRHTNDYDEIYYFIEESPMFETLYEASEWYYKSMDSIAQSKGKPSIGFMP